MKGFTVPEKLPDGSKSFELEFMIQFLDANKHLIEEWLKTESEEFATNYSSSLEEVLGGNGTTNQASEKIMKLVSDYNYKHRLRKDLAELASLERQYDSNLLPPPLPSEYVDSSAWNTGNEEQDEANWLGHGYYWKAGEGEMHKDLAYMDYDMIEDKWSKLRQAKVLVADYDLIRRDFSFLTDKTPAEINTWLIDNSAYLSEGQLKRISENGDLFDYMDLEQGLEHLVDTNNTRAALRMKGTDEMTKIYSVQEATGAVIVSMLEVKGGGTAIQQPDVTTKACGLLSLVDALKEFAYQKLIHRISEIYNSSPDVKEEEKWGTVQCYAIIDTGIRFRPDKSNPATGYKGDRCALCLRQRQSRLQSTFDEVVFYSVARQHLQITTRGKSIRRALNKLFLSSEQLPMTLAGKSTDQLEEDLDDFSHWYVLPNSALPDVWKMSPEAAKTAFKLGGEFLGLFEFPSITNFVYDTEDSDMARKMLEVEKKKISEDFKEFGECEVDDSPVMKWAIKEGTSFTGSAEDGEIKLVIDCWLPPLPPK